jgi:hypothetical protein
LSFGTTGAATFGGSVFTSVLDLGTFGPFQRKISASGNYNVAMLSSIGSFIFVGDSTTGAIIGGGGIKIASDQGLQFMLGKSFGLNAMSFANLSSPSVGVLKIESGAYGSGTLGSLQAGAATFSGNITASNALFHKVNTSATSYEALQIDATGDASNFDIAASIGSAGGTARGIRIGGKNAAGTFTSWIEFLTNGRQRQFGVETYNVGTAVGHQVIGGSFLWGHNNSGLVLNSGNRIGWAGGIESSPSHVIIPVGSTIDTRSGAGFRVRNSSNTDYESLECKAITASGTINGRASTTSAATAPIKIATGVLMTTPEAGAIEYDGTDLYFTDSGGVRRQLAVV